MIQNFYIFEMIVQLCIELCIDKDKGLIKQNDVRNCCLGDVSD